ncbi:hypothetical protein [Spirosoma lituiforme]
MESKLPLSNIQLELLKVFSRNVPDDDLKEIKALISNYFAHKAAQLADDAWNEDNLSEETMNKWRQTHLRTAYIVRPEAGTQS